MPTATTPIAADAVRQPQDWPIAEDRGPPRTKARDVPAYTIAMALPCCPRGTRVAATGATTAQNTPCVAAQSNRPITSIG